MDAELLVKQFPMPTAGLIRDAYWDLYLSENGTDAQKERLGDASQLPRPWDIATCTDADLRGDLWKWYEAVVIWFNHEYVWDPAAGMIPPCWLLHPHLIHDIGVLADQRRRIGLATNSNALEEWHRYAISAFLDRLRDRVKQHCSDQHQAWPAKARFIRHRSEPEAASRSMAVDQDLLELTADQQNDGPPALRLVDDRTDRCIDAATGELL